MTDLDSAFVASPLNSSSPDPIFAAIAAMRAAHVAHGKAIHAQSEAEKRYGHRSDKSFDACERAEAAFYATCDAAWEVATTVPTTLAGMLAVLHFANEHEDERIEWPTNAVAGSERWHYQLRATLVQAMETFIRKEGLPAHRRRTRAAAVGGRGGLHR